MNYRHAYHAGNFADGMKHVLLVWALRALAAKDKPFMVLDTHAGLGHYDLNSDESLRTGEATSGIFRLLAEHPAALADYLGVIETLGLYPGSPAIAQALMRPGDRLVACELHREDYVKLRRFFRSNPEVSTHLRDGYEAIGAFLPPPERRGLILIDPPYEAEDEFAKVTAAIMAAHKRFAAGVILAWYPIKHRTPVRAFHHALRESGVRDVQAAELYLREPVDAARLNGCGVVMVNAPWTAPADVPPLLAGLLAGLGATESGAGSALIRLTDE